jgi:murein DD-endopeptidase MepM/ murein hydrolase activator NlpD
MTRSAAVAVAVGVLAAGCAHPPPLPPLASLDDGKLVTRYELDGFAGGNLTVQLTTDRRRVAEWIANGYAFPIAVDIDRKTNHLRESGRLRDLVVPPGGTVRVASWDIDDTAGRWREHTDIHSQYGDPRAAAVPYLYALPFTAGESHRVMQGFNGQFSHNGDEAYAVDFDMPEGTVVRAARDGIVVAYNDRATDHSLDPEYKKRRHANWIAVLHADGTLGEYWHLMPGGVSARIGERVARGDALGRSGWTGFSTAPHLHFIVHTAVDGEHARSFRFVFKIRPDDTTGVEPLRGRTYTAFE